MLETAAEGTKATKGGSNPNGSANELLDTKRKRSSYKNYY